MKYKTEIDQIGSLKLSSEASMSSPLGSLIEAYLLGC